MLSEHGLIIWGNESTTDRCCFSRYHDMLYAFRHFNDGIAYYRLIGICNIQSKELKRFVKRANEIGHVESKKGGSKITDGGIEYNDFWFAVQDRFGIRDMVSSTFKIYDLAYNEEKIKTLMSKVSNGDVQKNPCYKIHYGRVQRDSITSYLDWFRYLEKHREGVKITDLIAKTGISSRYNQFRDFAFSRQHIKFSEERKTNRSPFIMATTEGLTLLKAVDWLVTSCDLGDYVPSILGP